MNTIVQALSAEEWSIFAKSGYAAGTLARLGRAAAFLPTRPLAFFAVINDSLPDDDPRKITWETVRALRTAYLQFGQTNADTDAVLAAANLLASYLPPSPDDPYTLDANDPM